ncbi:Pbn1p [Ascoidea rubescens DSM 1968]|uniref:Protein PBN1 n=1 Tax=Ascoidea rubescens DSM 1968 TaxID=1344418 RepID=A0A1D2VBS2_9ASCO|nr:PIG-X-domain-containing protein [Ascoidea rubescens DSM 1968]ODV59002.1 PIG-X-domain-containing protein [Ascoidea rubescens DSM 1968]
MSTIKQRITLLVDDKGDKKININDPLEGLVLSENKWFVPNGEYERQDRFVIPSSLIDLSKLSGIDKFSIEWSSFDETSKNSEVFSKNIPSGLNYYLKPKDGANASTSFDELFNFIDNNKNISIENFIQTPLSFQYHEDNNFEVPTEISKFISNLICDYDNQISSDRKKQYCLTKLNRDLLSISSFSIEYNGKFKDKNNMVITLYWPRINFNSMIMISEYIDKELGVFSIDKKLSIKYQDLVLLGFIDNLKIDDFNKNFPEKGIKKVRKTMVSIEPRHKFYREQNFESFFKQPNGLNEKHHVIISDFSNEAPMNKEIFDCELFLYYETNKEIFFDKYQLVENSKKENYKLVGLWGESDLEKPVYSIDKWGSIGLFQADINKKNSIEIPLHFRYLEPSLNSSNSNKHFMKKPEVFWACELSIDKLNKFYAEQNDNLKVSDYEELVEKYQKTYSKRNPLDLKSELNYESFFTDNTIFFHLKSGAVNETTHSAETLTEGGYLVDEYSLPVPKFNDISIVRIVTSIVMVLSFGFIFAKLITNRRKMLVKASKKQN